MRLSVALTAAALIGTGLAQQPASDSPVVIRSSTREVLLEVVVRDAHGKLVTKIDPSQIEIYEDGVRQGIRSFRLVSGREVRVEDQKQAQQADRIAAKPALNQRPPFNPLRTVNVVCLILNDLTPETRAFAFEAAKKFVDNELRPDTFIGVFSLDSTGMRPVFPFSNSRENLGKAIELAAVNQLPALAQSTAAMLNGLALGAGIVVSPGGASAEGTADGSSALDPLGTRGDMGIAIQAGLREIDSLKALIRQLSQLPFQKTVMLMSSGLTRPPDQLEYWNSLIQSANKGGVTFYGLDVAGLGPCQGNSNPDCTSATPSAGAVALLNKTASLSAAQSSVGAGVGKATPRAGAGVNIGQSDTAQLMEAMHQSDYLRFGVLSANRQEALREIAESTGGFLIANTNNLDLLNHVMEDVDTHFELSYRPASEIDDGHFRKINVKLARADLHARTRSGYFAIPDTGQGSLTPAEMSCLRALDADPRPHAFDFESKAFRFRCGKGVCQYAIAFEVPIANLTATPEPAEKKQRFHASLLALVKDARGEIVERVSKDVPSEVADESLPALRADRMTYEHAVDLAPGRYTVETAVVDAEGNRSSTRMDQIDNRAQPGLALSEIALLHRVQDLTRPPDASDPFEIPGKRATPYVSTTIPAGPEPLVFFVVYVDETSRDAPALRAQFLANGRVIATQKSALPPADDSGAIPMAIRAIAKPGAYEVRVFVEQGRHSAQQTLKYTVAPN
jgi:VWFA-related protein